MKDEIKTNSLVQKMAPDELPTAFTFGQHIPEASNWYVIEKLIVRDVEDFSLKLKIHHNPIDYTTQFTDHSGSDMSRKEPAKANKSWLALLFETFETVYQ